MSAPEEGVPGAPTDWGAAGTLEELLGLTRRFLTGTLDRFPGWGAGDLDDETDDLREGLLRAVGAGVLPVASQPGEPFAPGHDGLDWGRRAFVGGFLAPARAAAIVAAVTPLGLEVLLQGPGQPRSTRSVPVGLRDGLPFLVLGPDAREQELEIFAEGAGPRAEAALARCAYLWLFDPVWGRREALPAALVSLPQ